MGRRHRRSGVVNDMLVSDMDDDNKKRVYVMNDLRSERVEIEMLYVERRIRG
jgi:hypothetical protein